MSVAFGKRNDRFRRAIAPEGTRDLPPRASQQKNRDSTTARARGLALVQLKSPAAVIGGRVMAL
jgi:hypothetical protein